MARIICIVLSLAGFIHVAIEALVTALQTIRLF